MSLIKNLVERIETQNTKGYTTEQKKHRKPALPVSKKLTQPQQNDQTELKQQNKTEEKKHKHKRCRVNLVRMQAHQSASFHTQNRNGLTVQTK